MKTIARFSLFAFVALSFACAPATNTNTNTNSNTNTNITAAPKAAAPTADSLLAMENKAWEAWKNRDAKFFEGMLSESFVGLEMGKRLTKAEMLKMIGEHKCEVKSFSLSEPKLTPVGPDVTVLTYKATTDASCDGHKTPANVIGSSVLVREGDTWKGAYHGEVEVVAQATSGAQANSNGAAGANKDNSAVAKKDPPVVVNANTSNASNSAAPSTGDTLTDALMAVEKRGWEAWMRQDAKALEELTGPELAFINGAGVATFGKAEVIKMWTDGSCKISSVDVSNGKATMIANNVALLTFKGTANATCGGSKVPPVWATTVAMKHGDTWKAYYTFEIPVSAGGATP